MTVRLMEYIPALRDREKKITAAFIDNGCCPAMKLLRITTLLSCLFSFAGLGCDAQDVIEVVWPTRFASKPATFARPASDFLPAFRIALAAFPESNIVALALSQPAFLGIPATDAKFLQSLCGERHRLIRSDPAFKSVSSALPYCFSERTPTNGLALVYRPKTSDSNTPVVVFLHGYGGSFLWYQHLLAEAFPNHIIVCPAYGVSPAMIPSAYVSECLKAASGELGHSLSVPALIGLSAGGFGATRVYTQSPGMFSRLILIASYPPPETLTRFHSEMRVYAAAGAQEDYVKSGLFRRSLESIRPRVDTVEYQTLANANHYFLLARREETVKLLHLWLK